MFANNSTLNQRSGALTTRTGGCCGRRTGTACCPQLNEQKCIFVSFYLATASRGENKHTHSVAPSVIAKHMPSFGLPCALDKSIMLSMLQSHALLPLIPLGGAAAAAAAAASCALKCRRQSNDCCHLSAVGIRLYLHSRNALDKAVKINRNLKKSSRERKEY